MTSSTAKLTIDDVKHTEEYTIGCLSVPNHHGDTRLMWDTRDELSVAEVRARFDELVQKGSLAYKVEESAGFAGEAIREFDPTAERIVVSRPLVGG